VSEQTSNKRIERRRFLGAIAAAGTTAAVAAAIAAPATAEVAQTTKPEGPQEGYRETAHIRRYYETARF
jgi:nitrous oxide reductase